MPSTTYLMLRKPRSGCLEARTAPMQSHFSAVRQFPYSLEGRCLWLAWIPACAAMVIENNEFMLAKVR